MAGRLLPPPTDKSREKGYADRAENQYWVDERGVITLLQSRRRVRALREGVEAVSYLHHYYADTAEGVLKSEHVWGASVASEAWVGRGYLRLDLSLGGPLDRLKDHELGYEIRVTTDVPAHTLIQADEFSEETLLRCVFQSGRRPTKIWAFRNISRQEAPGEPEVGSALDLDISGMAQDTFPSSQPGKVSGIGWKW